ncbi:hypothetical protein BGZ70_005612 [Mortierella alpina]|uniref:Uncharacterized protein n=1 Tax=Mortierella alpina TaxID=64518 RepID=A0A9P6JF92_MORAP|nr:hypothetical protein BGZ70_005612 [Mortierella alpina]
MRTPSFTTIHNIQIFTVGLICGSILLFIVSYAVEGGVGITPYYRIITNANAITFLYLKKDMSIRGKRKQQIFVLCLSCLMVLFFLSSAGRLIYDAKTQGTTIKYLVVGFDIPIAILFIAEAVLMELYCTHLNSQNATSTRSDAVDLDREIHDRPFGSDAPASASVSPHRHNGTPNP